MADLDEDARRFAKENLNETNETREKALRALRSWLEDDRKINASSEDDVLLAFLRGAKFNLEKAKTKIGNYYRMRTLVPEWFSNRDPALPEIRELLNQGVFVPLRRFHENRLVVIIRVAAHDPKRHLQNDVFKTGMMVLDAAARERVNAQIYGVSAIFDMSGLSIGHARQLTPSMIKKAVHSWQNYHCRPKQLEFVNAPLYINVVLNVFKGFMSEKLKGRVRVHFRGLGALHSVIDKSILPTEYGGSDGPLQEHIDLWRERLEGYRDWFAFDEQFKAVV